MLTLAVLCIIVAGRVESNPIDYEGLLLFIVLASEALVFMLWYRSRQSRKKRVQLTKADIIRLSDEAGTRRSTSRV